MTIFEKWARVPARQPIIFHLGAALLVVLMTLGIYKHTTSYGYLDWDDNTLVQQNPYVIYPPFWKHTKDLFIPGRTPGPHLPLRTATYIFDREVLGKGASPRVVPQYHHVTNVVLYALNGLLLLWVLRKLLDPWAAAIATLIWVAHPVHVEGVCWVSGRKEMLAAGFVFGALLSYIYATEALRDAGGVRPLAASLIGTVIATIISWVAIKHPEMVHAPAGVYGLTSLGVLLAGCVAYGVLAGGDKRWRAGILLALSVFCALCGALSKPVAICIPPILFCWELGYRPRRAKQDMAAKPLPADGGAPAADAKAPATGIIAWIETHFFGLDEARGVFARLAPHAAMAAWGAVMTVGLAGKNQVLKEATWNAAPKSQNLASFVAAWLDIYHLIAPLKLSALYYINSEQWTWQAYAGVAILVSIPFLAAWLLRKNPKALLWLAFFLVPLIPVSGIWRLASAHADRYLFIPAVALAVGLGVLLSEAAFGAEDPETNLWERVMAAVLSVAIIGGFSVLSYQRSRVWERDEYLWGDAVYNNPELPSARNNYGAALMNAGKIDQALEQYYAAYKILPTLDVAQFNIAATEMRRGNVNVAQKYAEEFNAQHKEMPTGWILLGQLYSTQARALEATDPAAAKEKLAKAADSYKSGCEVPVDDAAILQKQDRASSCNQWAIALSLAGDDEGAVKAWDEGLKSAPGNRQLVMNRAKYFRQKKQFDRALQDLLALDPASDPDVYRNLAQTYYEMGDKQRALDYMEALMKSGRYNQRDYEMYNGLKTVMDQEKLVPKGTATPAPKAK